MSEFASLLIVAVIWFFVSLYKAGSNKGAKKGADGAASRSARPGSPARKAQDQPEKEAVRPAPRRSSGFPVLSNVDWGSLSASPIEGTDPCHDDPESLRPGSLRVDLPEGTDPCHDNPETLRPGSLRVDLPEGTDPCHDGLRAASFRTDEEEEEAAGPLNLSWAGSDIVKGFIYGEILNRKRA